KPVQMSPPQTKTNDSTTPRKAQPTTTASGRSHNHGRRRTVNLSRDSSDRPTTAYTANKPTSPRYLTVRAARPPKSRAQVPPPVHANQEPPASCPNQESTIPVRSPPADADTTSNE